MSVSLLVVCSDCDSRLWVADSITLWGAPQKMPTIQLYHKGKRVTEHIAAEGAIDALEKARPRLPDSTSPPLICPSKMSIQESKQGGLSRPEGLTALQCTHMLLRTVRLLHPILTFILHWASHLERDGSQTCCLQIKLMILRNTDLKLKPRQ